MAERSKGSPTELPKVGWHGTTRQRYIPYLAKLLSLISEAVAAIAGVTIGAAVVFRRGLGKASRVHGGAVTDLSGLGVIHGCRGNDSCYAYI